MSSLYPVRINKFISATGYCPRKKADALIKAQRVTLNGATCRLGTPVMPSDQVKVDNIELSHDQYTEKVPVYLAYHKPPGVTCSAAPSVDNNIVQAVPHEQRIFPIGRLDKASEGLLLLTSDGDIVNKILRSENAHDKEYIVEVDRPLTPGFAKKMSTGVSILDTVTKPCTVELLATRTFRIILHQGLNRQIRRMCKALGYNVTRLTRVRIMNITLSDIEPGSWRYLSQEELHQLKSAISDSSNT
jgi:23S rRNA pseudouridine2604 synthase/16S rRNA pseudouridine516 synthase